MSAAGVAVRVVVIAVFTAVETAALGGWLSFVDGAAAVSRAVAIGLGILLVGLFVEHVLTDVAVNGVDLSFPAGKVALFSVSETALWALWLLVADRVGGRTGLAVAGVALAVLLVPQHTVEDSVLRGERLLSDLVDRGTVGFSVVEAAGATAWLAFVRGDPALEQVLVGPLATVDPALVGLGVLAVALFVEHDMGVRFSSRV